MTDRVGTRTDENWKNMMMAAAKIPDCCVPCRSVVETGWKIGAGVDGKCSAGLKNN
jgi:hypothetical protein